MADISSTLIPREGWAGHNTGPSTMDKTVAGYPPTTGG